jgi:hypothetical protein
MFKYRPLILASAMVFLGSPGFAASNADCSRAFQTSSAAATCQVVDVLVLSDIQQCTVTFECQGGKRGQVTTRLTNIKQLKNCNGQLKVGKC